MIENEPIFWYFGRMHTRRIYVGIVIILAVFLGVYLFSRPANAPINSDYSVTTFTKDLPGVRVVVFDDSGKVFASQPKEGKIVRLDDSNNDGVADKTVTILSGLREPHGLAFYQDAKTKSRYLYVAETHQVVRYAYDQNKGLVSGQGKNIMNFPADGLHPWRSIVFGPNLRTGAIISGGGPLSDPPGAYSPVKLYATVPSSCDACIESSWKSGAIIESDPEGTYAAEVASGFADAEFLTFRPDTKELWATDAGRIQGPSDVPGEINLVQLKKNYGWPICYGNKIADTSFKPGKIERTDIPKECSGTQSPSAVTSHSSRPLGLAFIPKSEKWPQNLRGNLLVALSSDKKVVRYSVSGQNLETPEDFNVNLGDSGKISALAISPDGALYVSDEDRGVIFRILPPAL